MWPRVALISPSRFQGLHRDGHARAAHPEHHGQELVHERQIVPVHPVVAHQQPAGEALLDGVAAVRQSRVGHLYVERLRIAKQMLVQRRAGANGRAQIINRRAARLIQAPG